MKVIQIVLVPVLVVCAVVVWSMSASPATRGEPVLDAMAPTPSAVATLRVDGQTRVAASAGEDVHTPFLIGSLSKAFTAVAVMQQVEAGTLMLDEPLGDEVPAALSGVTVRRLLHHTTGLSRRAGLRLADRPESGPTALHDLVFSLGDDDLSGVPDRYEYSDANYLVLGYLVQQAADQDFGEYLESKVFRSLGMTDSRATAAGASSSGVGAGHRIVFGRAVGYDRAYSTTGAAYGYIVSSATDLATFGDWLLHPQRRPGVLRPVSVATLMEPGPELDDGRHYAMGLRVGPLDGDGPTVVEHTGATPGFFAHLLLTPETDAVVVVLGDAYSESVAGELTGVGWNLIRSAAGREQEAPSRAWVLWALPWILLVLAAGAVTVLGRQARRLRAGPGDDVGSVSRRAGWSGVVVAAAVVALMIGLPRLLGVGWRELLIWAPDVSWSAIVLGGASAAVGAVVLARLMRNRPTRKTTS